MHKFGQKLTDCKPWLLRHCKFAHWRLHCRVFHFASCFGLFLLPTLCACVCQMKSNLVLITVTVCGLLRTVGEKVIRTLAWQRVNWLVWEEWVLSWLNALFCKFLILLQSFECGGEAASPPTQFLRPGIWWPCLLFLFSLQPKMLSKYILREWASFLFYKIIEA